MPDDVVSAFRADQRTAIVALTDDPKLDDLALLEALDTSSFYIGAIGSRRNQSARRSRLKEHFEQTDETLSRLRTGAAAPPPHSTVTLFARLRGLSTSVPLASAVW